MIEKIDNNEIVSFPEILTKYNIFSNRHIKSMCRKSSMTHVNTSHLLGVNENNIYFEGKIVYENKPIWYLTDDIDNNYEDAILVHCHTRSINNILMKSFVTLFSGKEFHNKQGFLDFISVLDMNYDKDNIIEKFEEYIGIKAKLPFCHSTSKKIGTNICITYNVYHYKYNLINIAKEKQIIQTFLNNDKIDINKYEVFVKLLTNEINNKHYSTFYK
jgi:hypothetical protein